MNLCDLAVESIAGLQPYVPENQLRNCNVNMA